MEVLEERLARARSIDGGYGSVAGAAPEPEPTAMAALALRDRGAVAWLLEHQEPDGSFGIRVGEVMADDTSIVSLALPDGPNLDRALDHVESSFGSNAVERPGEPPFGWPWTAGAHGWIEPTAWAVLALRRLRPAAAGRIEDGLAVLRERECVGGGWNYGTRITFGVALEPFAQTTAIALIATVGADPELTSRGAAALRRTWRREAVGLLSLATAAAAFRVLDDEELRPARRMLEDVAAEAPADTVALAWAVLAMGDGYRSLVVTT
jgi:hypothetical protein